MFGTTSTSVQTYELTKYPTNPSFRPAQYCDPSIGAHFGDFQYQNPSFGYVRHHGNQLSIVYNHQSGQIPFQISGIPCDTFNLDEVEVFSVVDRLI